MKIEINLKKKINIYDCSYKYSILFENSKSEVINKNEN